MEAIRYECYLCHKKIKLKKSSLIRHMEVNFRSTFFQCPYKKCKGTFTKKYNLKVHYENKHSGIVFSRNLKKVTTKAYSAKSGKTYPCPMCNKLFRGETLYVERPK